MAAAEAAVASKNTLLFCSKTSQHIEECPLRGSGAETAPLQLVQAVQAPLLTKNC
jgi:hypothetical protein